MLFKAIAACVAVSVGANAQPKVTYPTLPNTTVYKSHSGCAPVDLTRWHHPTTSVLQQAGVTLRALDLCDGRKYPIFHVSADNNPLRVSDPFYLGLYARMWIANGKNPMALDIENWHDLVDLQHASAGAGVSETDENYQS